MATLAQLQNRVQSTLGLKASGNELTLLTGYINEGYTDVLKRTHCRVNCGDLTTIANTWKYRTSSSILAVNEMWTEDAGTGTTPMFQRVTARDIIEARRAQSAYTAGLSLYALEGSDFLMLWPTPLTAGTIEYLYVPRPTDLSGASDTPTTGGVPAEYHKAIEMYACWRMADYDDDGSSQVGEVYRVHYEGADGRGGILREIRQSLNDMGGRRLPTARVGRRGSRRLVSSRSVDW